MERKHSETAIKAKELYDQGMSLVDIAKELGKPPGTIRRWKHDHAWDEKGERSGKKSERSGKKKTEKRAAVEEGEQALQNPELTEKQQLFCVLFASGDSATSAYQKAYSCSYQAAMAAASRMLRNVKVREEVNRLKKERFETQMFEEHDIFQWYLDVARANITDFVEFGQEEVQVIGAFGPVKDKETGEPVMKTINYVKFKESSEVNGHVIKKVKLGKDGASIELHDSMKAMEWLADHMSMGTGKQQGIAQNIISAWEKRKAERGGEE